MPQLPLLSRGGQAHFYGEAYNQQDKLKKQKY